MSYKFPKDDCRFLYALKRGFPFMLCSIILAVQEIPLGRILGKSVTALKIFVSFFLPWVTNA